MKGARKDRYGIRAYVKVRTVQREKRFPAGTAAATIKRWQDETRASLRTLHPTHGRGTLAADVERYILDLDLVSATDRARDARAWLPRFGHLRVFALNVDDLNAQLREWRRERSASTCNHRRDALTNLVLTRYGKQAAARVADLVRFSTPDPVVKGIALPMIDAVLPRVPGKTRPRLLLMRWTGMRPSQMGRLDPDHFDLLGTPPSVVVPRGKKGRLVRLPLVQPEGLTAAYEFFAADAFRPWSTASANKALKRAIKAENTVREQRGEPARIPIFTVYQIKHSVGKRLRETGTDLADIQEAFGHADPRTTAIYAPPVNARLVVGFDRLRAAPPLATSAGTPHAADGIKR